MSNFFRRLLIHATLALGLWYVAALALERLVPGFVTPFVNLPGVGLACIAAASVALAVGPSETSRLGRTTSLVVLAVLLICACLFLWTRVNDLGGLGIGLMFATIGSIALLGIAFWQDDRRS